MMHSVEGGENGVGENEGNKKGGEQSDDNGEEPEQIKKGAKSGYNIRDVIF